MQPLLKVLIADDEPNIREGIRYSIDWHEIGMEVVAEAEDGEEALELALKYEVDVLLADLNMPIMNGLTLIKNLKEKLPTCRVVIITGHDEFSYAQEALRLAVEDYILKPIKPDSLTEVLKKVHHKLQTQTAQRKYLEIASNHISQNTLLIQEQFCLNWVEGKLSDGKIKEQLGFWGLPEEVPLLLAVVRIQELEISKQPLIQGTEKEVFIFRVKQIIVEILELQPKLVFSDESGMLFLLLWGYVQEETFSKIERRIESNLHVSPTLFSTSITGDFDSVPSCYQSYKQKDHEEFLLSPIVRRAKTYIREQYTNPDLTLECVAQQLQISSVYLSRMIKQGLGTSFVGLVTEMRIKKALMLLNSTNLQVNEIAEQVGYESQHYFSTAFKKVVGVSPNQYRKGAVLLADS
ncbi:two-component system response regulator YesN [Bacillus niacini]|uniref:Two-component system response regulator YesN n=1 Tax=Neobacillus niacini TaxID=86668 RepID=A0A852TDE0_9BACI|nr:response regulator [Neobacillus niacini]NYE05806.1 two-component system response regulator YesN [Neobacillus niacini]